ncbi:MAG: dTDP-4-dehydrorhamnose reductase [Calditrichia bacterium]|nr:dTDP-4-dehydrorhamnose reductase [Calditrichia bacterium]
MRVLVTGVNGLLGQKVLKELFTDNELLVCDIQENIFNQEFSANYHKIDITNYDIVKKTLQEFNPDFVVNCAAYTNVDGCETEKELSWSVNVKAVENLAYFSRKFDFHLIHISTDYLFNGEKGLYKEDDKPEPLSFYGKEKLAAEKAVIQHAGKYTILRTNVLFGASYGGGLNFITWLIKQLKSGNKVNIVDDQYNNAALAEDLAWSINAVIKNKKEGIFNIAGKEYLNRFEMAKEVAKILNVPVDRINPIKTEQLKQAAQRPLKGGLNIKYAEKELKYSPTLFTQAIVLVLKQMKEMEQI